MGEPFSGMCMHPVEHLYYFSNCLFPTLFLPGLSPLIFLWIVVHLTLAPGAGHSGFEDHFQADQYHYLHHAKFECNYGSPFSAPIDMYMGTFREALGEPKEYKGEWQGIQQKEQKGNGSSAEPLLLGLSEKKLGETAVHPWSPQGYLGIQTGTHLVYTLYCFAVSCLCIVYFVYAPLERETHPIPEAAEATEAEAAEAETLGWRVIEVILPGLVSFSPIVIAFVLCVSSRDPMSWRWPFHRERVFGALGVFCVAGGLACVFPVYKFIELGIQSNSEDIAKNF